MLRKGFVLMMMGTVIFFLYSFSSADVPHMINYQGRLTTASGGCLNDTVQMTFTIYSDSLGVSPDWTETQTEVAIKEGVFSVLLGAVDTIPTTVFDGSTKYLGVQVETDPEMRPLKPMVSTSYAFGSHRSQEADTADYARAAPAASDGDWTMSGDDIYRPAGRVGVGTSMPNRTLSVEGDVEIQSGYSGVGHFGYHSGLLEIQAEGIDGIRFNTQGANEKMRIASSGNVGIGRTNPGYLLHIQSSSNPEFGITKSGVNTFLLNVTGAVGQTDYLNLLNHGQDTIIIASFGDNGNVGIGTTEPQTTLHVRDGGIIVGMGVGGCAGSGKIVQDCDLNVTKFQTMNNNVWSDAMVIAHTRNVGIGTVSPQGALDVNSTTGAFIVPRMTTTQRDALTTVNGMIIYNTTTSQFNFYENGAWVTK
jgi:hypothetical protein